MNKYEKRNFNKARRLINWSFALILCPTISITFAAIAKSILNDIPEQDETDEERIARLFARGTTSIFLCCLSIGVSIALWSYVEYRINSQ